MCTAHVKVCDHVYTMAPLINELTSSALSGYLQGLFRYKSVKGKTTLKKTHVCLSVQR